MRCFYVMGIACLPHQSSGALVAIFFCLLQIAKCGAQSCSRLAIAAPTNGFCAVFQKLCHFISPDGFSHPAKVAHAWVPANAVN